MQLILFIGHHKVGSSSLQAFLAANRNRLIEAGILYPLIEEKNTSAVLQSAGKNLRGRLLGKSPYERITVNEREPHNALAFRLIKEARGKSGPVAVHGNVPGSADMLATIRKQMSSSQPEALVLCSEVFSHFGEVSPELIHWLRKSFPADEVKILCTLRRVDQYLCSWYGQRLKFGHRQPPLRRRPGVKQFRRSIHFNYRRVVRPWIKHFPEAEINLRNYAQVLENGGSVQDFITQSGLQFPAGLAEYPNINPSIPYCYYELCRKINSIMPRPRSGPVIRRVIELGKDLDTPKNGEVELLGARNRQWLYRNFEEIHAFLARQTGADAFFPDQEKVLDCNPLGEFAAARRAVPALVDALGHTPVDRTILKAVERLDLNRD